MRPRDVLATNLRKLMAAASGLSRLPDLVAASDGALTNGTLDRVRRATHATNIDTLEQLAEVFGVEPWQLLVPTLHAEPAGGRDKVKLSGLPDWPFAMVEREQWLALEPERRIFLEGKIAQMLADESVPLDVPPTDVALQKLKEARFTQSKPARRKTG